MALLQVLFVIICASYIGLTYTQDIIVLGLDPCRDEITCDVLPPNTLFPVPGACNLFQSCTVTGQLTIQSCRSGQSFDYIDRVCSNRRNPLCYPACEEIQPSPTVLTTTTTAKPDPTLSSNATTNNATWGRHSLYPARTTIGLFNPTAGNNASFDHVITPLTSTLSKATLKDTQSISTTPRTVQSLPERCAPPADICTPGQQFGYIHDCSQYYRCQDPSTSTDGKYWRLVRCWSNQGFDVVSQRCVSENVALCENSCPGYARTTTTSTSTTTTTSTVNTTTAPNMISTTIPDNDVSMPVTTISGIPKQSISTPPNPILDPEAECAPAESVCVPGEQFGYAFECNKYYECLDSSNGGPYYELRSCWSNQGFDIYSRKCIDALIATCESSCPGYIRTTPSTTTTTTTTLPPSTTDSITTLFAVTTDEVDITAAELEITSVEMDTTMFEQSTEVEATTVEDEIFTTVESAVVELTSESAYDATTQILDSSTIVDSDVLTTEPVITSTYVSTKKNDVTTPKYTSAESSTKFTSTNAVTPSVSDNNVPVQSTSNQIVPLQTTYASTTNGATEITTNYPFAFASTQAQSMSSVIDLHAKTTTEYDLSTADIETTAPENLSTIRSSPSTSFTIPSSGTTELEDELITTPLPVIVTDAYTNEVAETTVDYTSQVFIDTTMYEYSGEFSETTFEQESFTSVIPTQTTDEQVVGSTERPYVTSPGPITNAASPNAQSTVDMNVLTTAKLEPTTNVLDVVTTNNDVRTTELDSSTPVTAEFTTHDAETTTYISTTLGTEFATSEETYSTTIDYSLPAVLSTTCNRQEPCFIDSVLPDPEDCNKYFECGVNRRWQSRSCADNIFDIVTNECQEDGECTEECINNTETTSVVSGSTVPGTTDTITTVPSTFRPTVPNPGRILNLEVSMISNDAIAGEDLTAQCSFFVEPSGIRFTLNWYLNKTLLRQSDRIKIYGQTPQNSNSNTHTSVIVFMPVTAKDTGFLTCHVELQPPYTDKKNMTVPLNVLAIPQTKLTPMTATMQRGRAVILTCTAMITKTGHPLENVELDILWYRNGTSIDDREYFTDLGDEEDLIEMPNYSLLTVSPQYSTEYSCSAQNPNVTQDEGPKQISQVYVVKSAQPVCQEETINGITWSTTPAGAVNIQPCQDDMIGNATRACDAEGTNGAKWAKPNLLNCVNPAFMEISDEIARLQEGIGGSEEAAQISEELEQATNTTTMLPPGDINSAVTSMNEMGMLRTTPNTLDVKLSEKEVEAMIGTVSNLLVDTHIESWQDVLQVYPYKAVEMMSTVDSYGGVFAYQMSTDDNDLITTKMMLLEIDTMNKDDTADMSYPNTENWDNDGYMQDNIRISKQTLDNIAINLPTDKLALSSSYYKTLQTLLPAAQDYDEEAYIDSRVLALSVNGVRGMRLEPPIQITLSHGEIPEEKEANCSFWNYTRNAWSTEGCTVIGSNDTHTSCECDHLTNFAILVSKNPAEGKHATALSIISIVGCVISIGGLLLTILVYVSIWKHVKSHHAVVLLNLCIALLLANLIFVVGVDKTGNEALCTAIAAMLHYFYLAAFFIMLVEGVQLVLYIIYVFHVRRKRETAGMLLLAWLVPAAIVGICLGISQTEGYGTEDYCWLDAESWLFWAFIVPVMIIIIINVGILVAVLKRISQSKLHQVDKTRNQRIRSAGWNIVVIMPILGITWLFGIFAVNSGAVVFQYLFAVSNSLQGLFIFIFHAVCNKKVREALTRSLPASSTASTSGVLSHLPGKIKDNMKGNYSVKTNSSQRTQRSRLKSDSSGMKKAKKDTKMKKSRKGSENQYDTIPAEYDMNTPPKGQMAPENVYSESDEVHHKHPPPTTADQHMTSSTGPDLILQTNNSANSQIDGNQNSTEPSRKHIYFEDVFRADSKYKPNGSASEVKERKESEDNYMVPVTQQNDLGSGFINPVFDAYGDTDLINIDMVKMNDSASPRPNSVSQKRLPRTQLSPSPSNSMSHDIPPPYHLQTPPLSVQSSMNRGNNTNSISKTDSNSSFQRDLRDKLKRVDEMKTTEFMDMNLRKSESPRVTPRSSPYLPRSTPFLNKHNQNKPAS